MDTKEKKQEELQEELNYEQAFKTLYPKMQSYCYAQTGGDAYAADVITSQTFLDLYYKWETLKIHTENVIIAWLYHASYYSLLNYYKEQKKNPVYLDMELYAEEHPDFHYLNFSEDPFPLEEYERYRQELGTIKRILSPSEWLLFESIVIKELDIKTAAKRAGIGYDLARVRWFHIRHKIRTALQKFF